MNHDGCAKRPRVAHDVRYLAFGALQVAERGGVLCRKQLETQPTRRLEGPTGTDDHRESLGIDGRRAGHLDPVPHDGHTSPTLDEEPAGRPRPELRDRVDMCDVDLPRGRVDRHPEDFSAEVRSADRVADVS